MTNHSLIAKLLFVFCIVAATAPANSQVNGCKDPLATNYNSAATVNDGSCIYGVTNYTPPVKVDPITSTLTESSGLQMAGNYLWSFNDGGGAAAVYRIDTLSNNLLQTVTLAGATNVDWEDIAFDGTYFYVGDFGNNANGARNNLKIYKFPLSAIPDYTTVTNATIPSSQIEIINFIYSDQPRPLVASASNKTKFDCEAMIVDGGKIHLFTKNWIDTTSTHYVINNIVAGSDTAYPVETLATGYLVTAADKAPGQSIVAFLGYQNGFPYNHFMHLLTDYSGGKYFNGNKRKLNLPDASLMGQAEGLTFRNDMYGYISNEKLFSINQKLRSFNLSSFVPQYVLPVKLKNFRVAEINGKHKIVWSFSSPVTNLQIQYSTDGQNFAAIKTLASSQSGNFARKPTSLLSYYRLAWQNGNGTLQYSNIISIKNIAAKPIENFLLRQSGELYFTANSSSGPCSFILTGADGKVLAKIDERQYNSGTNKVVFSKSLAAGNFVFLTALCDGQEITSTLLVGK